MSEFFDFSGKNRRFFAEIFSVDFFHGFFFPLPPKTEKSAEIYDFFFLGPDQYIEGHECILPMVRTSGKCRRLETNLIVEMSFYTGKEVEIFYTIVLE